MQAQTLSGEWVACLALADGDGKVLVQDLLVHSKLGAVQDLVLQEDHWIWVADGGFQETSCVLSIVGGNDLRQQAVATTCCTQCWTKTARLTRIGPRASAAACDGAPKSFQRAPAAGAPQHQEAVASGSAL